MNEERERAEALARDLYRLSGRVFDVPPANHMVEGWLRYLDLAPYLSFAATAVCAVCGIAWAGVLFSALGAFSVWSSRRYGWSAYTRGR